VPSISDLTVIKDRDPPFSTVSVANKERLPITAIGSVTLKVASTTGICVPMTDDAHQRLGGAHLGSLILDFHRGYARGYAKLEYGCDAHVPSGALHEQKRLDH